MNEKVTKSVLIAWFVKNPIAAKILMILIIAVGLQSLTRINIESFPTLPSETIIINAPYPGATPKEIEQNILIQIEQALSSVQGIEHIYSTAEKEAAQIQIRKKQFKNINVLLGEVTNKLNGMTDLPNKQTPPTISTEKNERSVVWISVSGDVPKDIFTQTARRLREQLIRQPNISNVELTGHQETEVAISLSQEKLRQYQLTFSEVSNILKDNNFQVNVGSLQSTSDEPLLLGIESDVGNAANIGNTLIKQGSLDNSLYLRDIATINQAYTKNHNLSLYNGNPAVILKVQSDEGTDFLNAYNETTNTVEEFLGTVSPAINIELWHNNTKVVSDRVSYFVKSGLLSMLLIFLTLAIFLQYKVAIWVSLGIPISFAGAFFLMPWFGLSINIVTLFAFIVALGIVVDDAIIIGESIYTTKQLGGDADASTVHGVSRVAIPATFGVLTTIAAFAPLTAISTNLGQQLGHFAWVVIFCLVFSIIESKLILPQHLKKLTVKKSEKSLIDKFRKKNHLTSVLKITFNRILNLALDYRYMVLLVFISIFLIAVGLMKNGTVGRIFFPEIENEFIEASFSVKAGQSTNEINKRAENIAQSLRKTSDSLLAEGVESRSPVKNIYVSANNNEIVVTGELQEIKHREISVNQISNMWRNSLAESSDLESDKFDSDGNEIFIDLYGKNFNKLHESSLELKRELKRYKGISQVDSSQDNTEAVVKISTSLEGKARGFTNKTLSDEIRSAFNGEQLYRINVNGAQKTVTLYHENTGTNSMGDLQNYVVRNSNDISSPLSSIADIKVTNEVKLVERVNGERIAWVSAGLDKSLYSPSEIIDDLENSEFLESFRQRYADIRISYAGEYEQEKSATHSFEIAFSLSIISIYLLLAIALKSFGKPFIILSLIPFGFVGVILGHMVIGIPISILSYFGFLALSGVVVNDCLILITTIYTSPKQDLRSRLLSATTERFRAVFLTSLTTFICLSPIIFSTSYQTQLFLPTAVALGFGILFATATTLILLPVNCLILHDLKSLRLSITKA